MPDDMPTNGAADFSDDTLRIARETMTGDLRDLVLDTLKHEKTALPWNLRPETEQQEVIDRVTTSIEAAVGKCVRIIAMDGKRALVASVDQVVVKDGIKVVAKVGRTQQSLLMLGEAVGQTVLITVADDDPYTGESRAAHPERLQGEMFDGGEDDDDGPVFDNTPSGDK